MQGCARTFLLTETEFAEGLSKVKQDCFTKTEVTDTIQQMGRTDKWGQLKSGGCRTSSCFPSIYYVWGY